VDFSEKRIAVFEPRPDLETNPTLVCLLRSLKEEGAEIDLFMPDSNDYPAVGMNLRRYPFPEPWRYWYFGIRSTLRSWRQQYHREVEIGQVFARRKYDLVFGIDSAGVVMGFKYAKRFNLPLIYLSFEISFWDELSLGSEIKEKRQECSASRFADLIIIQDEDRGHLLATENRLTQKKFEYLPVSADGIIRIKHPNYLRERYRIPDGQMLVLHSGSFGDWTYGYELLDSVMCWPKDFILVIHMRNKPDHADEYVRKIRAGCPVRFIFSEEPLTFNDHQELVASADIGLALYKPIIGLPYGQKNIEHIGLASGKLSSYMKYGLPVISVNQKFHAALLKEYAFGEVIASFAEMPAALIRIKTNYAYHRREARRLFSEKLDFDLHWPRVKRRLLDIIERDRDKV
jgi:hypothetical protein